MHQVFQVSFGTSFGFNSHWTRMFNFFKVWLCLQVSYVSESILKWIVNYSIIKLTWLIFPDYPLEMNFVLFLSFLCPFPSFLLSSHLSQPKKNYTIWYGVSLVHFILYFWILNKCLTIHRGSEYVWFRAPSHLSSRQQYSPIS